MPTKRPNANFDFVSVTYNSATSNYNALQIKLQRNLSNGLQALASYTFSHSIDIASTDAFATYLNTESSVANPNIDGGNSDFDIRHACTAGVTYNLPSPGWNNVAKATLGGCSVDSFILARTAPPVDVVGGLVFEDGIALYPRPDLVPGVPLVLYGSQYPGGKIFNSSAFTEPPTGQQGNFDAMCCAVSDPHKPMSRFSGNFTSRRGCSFASEANSSTSSTTQTLALPPTT